jgi:hypothetical protein
MPPYVYYTTTLRQLVGEATFADTSGVLKVLLPIVGWDAIVKVVISYRSLPLHPPGKIRSFETVTSTTSE